ncbi:hypothetical protein GCM10029964_093190 [Kibdelosporangium lantanae]
MGVAAPYRTVCSAFAVRGVGPDPPQPRDTRHRASGIPRELVPRHRRLRLVAENSQPRARLVLAEDLVVRCPR